MGGDARGLWFVALLAFAGAPACSCAREPCDGAAAAGCDGVAGEWSGSYTVVEGERAGSSGAFGFLVDRASCRIEGTVYYGLWSGVAADGLMCSEQRGEATLDDEQAAGFAELRFDGDIVEGDFRVDLKGPGGVIVGSSSGTFAGARGPAAGDSWSSTCTSACDDTVDCTLDGCSGDVCTHEPWHELCDDGNDCTVDSCAAGAGCLSETRAGACDDDNPCTVDDECASGQCAGAAVDGCTWCGNGLCEGGESCASCGDCPGRSTGNPAQRFCCGNGAEEQAEGDGSLCDGNW